MIRAILTFVVLLVLLPFPVAIVMFIVDMRRLRKFKAERLAAERRCPSGVNDSTRVK